MKIDWAIDEIDEIEEGEECVGTIILADDLGREIREESTYLDSWLVGLCRIMEGADEGQSHIIIDLAVEPNKLKVTIINNEVTIAYGDAKINLGQSSEFEKLLINSIKEYIIEAKKRSLGDMELCSEMETFLRNRGQSI